jgi:GNAT superfamily N-acetyltransferase
MGCAMDENGFPGAGGEIVLRPLRDDDSFELLTAMLHRAYRPLAEAGMRFVASWQSVEETRRRATNPGRTTIVAEQGGTIVGTITLIRAAPDDPCEHYRRPGVMLFGQFAVEPSLRGTGLGGRLLARAEELAREQGAEELALDTSERAAQLIRYYAGRGYRMVGRVRWDSVNYESVVMSKRLAAPAPGSAQRPGQAPGEPPHDRPLRTAAR